MQQQAAAAGGEAWVEELLIRGQPGGGIRGAHVLIGWRAPGINGATVGDAVGPYPLVVSTDDPAFAAIASAISASVVDQLAETQSALEESQALVASLQAQLDALQ